MLREISAVRQDSAETRRRWFQDEFFDLFVWQSRSGEFVAFQLCYDIKSNERAISWASPGRCSIERLQPSCGQ